MFIDSDFNSLKIEHRFASERDSRLRSCGVCACARIPSTMSEQGHGWGVCVCSNFNSLKIEHRLASERNAQPGSWVGVCVCSNFNSLKIEHRLASSSIVISGATKALVPAAPRTRGQQEPPRCQHEHETRAAAQVHGIPIWLFAKVPGCCRPVAIAHRAWGVEAFERVIRHERTHSCSRLDIRGGAVVCRKQRVWGRQNGRAQCACRCGTREVLCGGAWRRQGRRGEHRLHGTPLLPCP